MNGRLNIFQSGMLRWREVHPYNAVHVVRIGAPLDAVRLSAVIGARLAALGLTGLTLDAAHARYEYRGGPAHPEVRILDGGDDPRRAVTGEIERQLNLPFTPDGRIDPFRFFAVDAGQGFHLGLAYDHFIAGGDSIVLLVKDLAMHYTGSVPDDAPAQTLDRYPATFRQLAMRHPWRVLLGLRHTFATLASGRRAFRPRYPGGHDMRNGFVAQRVEPGDVARLKTAARNWGVTPNDLLLAMLLQALAPLAEERRNVARRNQLALASIINLRGEFAVPAATTFGQFLSSFHVIHRMPPGIGLEPLARDLHAQTAAVKAERRYYQTLLGIGATRVILRLLSPERRARFHGKSFPLWGGTTPLNVDALWMPAGTDEPPDYLRGVSTGPLMPLVVAVTIAAGALEIGLSYRTTAFTRENIAKIAVAILHSIQSLPA
jgi:hypothetical protein